MQGWWLDAVSEGKEWTAVRLPSGAMIPMLLRKRMGMRFVLMPQQTQIGGYWGNQDSASEIAQAIDGLHLDYYYQKYPIGQSKALELREKGFRVEEMITYRIEDLSSEEAIVKRFSENKRRQLKKAASLTADYSLTAAEFYPFHSECLTAQGKQISYSETFWMQLHAACEQHQAGQIVGLRNEDGRLVAAAFLVFDKKTTYYLIPAYDPSLGNNGSGARLVLEAIRFAAKHSEAFDFEGSMIPGVAEHYRQFASEARIYYSVEKIYNPLFRLLLLANKWQSRHKH